eukprot:SAG11_NODE_4528_length_1863_cov_4.993764_1_plen_28_part_10
MVLHMGRVWVVVWVVVIRDRGGRVIDPD